MTGLAQDATTLIGVLIVAASLWGVVAPRNMLDRVAAWENPRGVWAAAALRLVSGLIVAWAAPTSRAPIALMVIAGLFLVAGFALALAGVERFRAMAGFWRRQPPSLVRVSCALAAGFGAFLCWASLG